MNHNKKNTKPGPREAMASLWQVIISRSPTGDWAKGRVITLMVTVAAVVWTVSGIVELVAPDQGMNNSDRPADRIEVGADGESVDQGQSALGGRLRNDLFKIPKTKKETIRKAPKTNPVELLGLIELQGVLGGKTPRAIVLYKRTKKTSTVSVGDDLGEFMVVDIQDRSVILKWRDELFELSL